jgi:hypothetical protein
MDLRSKYSLEERIFLVSAYHRYDADYKNDFYRVWGEISK